MFDTLKSLKDSLEPSAEGGLLASVFASDWWFWGPMVALVVAAVFVIQPVPLAEQAKPEEVYKDNMLQSDEPNSRSDIDDYAPADVDINALLGGGTSSDSDTQVKGGEVYQAK